MSQEKSECTYRGCGREPLERSKDGRCIFHANPGEKDISQFNNALRHEIEMVELGGLTYSFEGFIFVGDINFRRELGVTVIKRGVPVGSVSKRVSFLDAQFRGKVYFSDIEFRAGVSFSDVEFHKSVFFKRTKFREGAYIAAKFITEGVSFAFAVLENVCLTPLNLDKNAWIDFTGARLRNTELRRKDIEDHILQDQKEHFSKAEEIYLLLKNNFHTTGRYSDESWAFKKEKDMERKSYFHISSFPKWLGSMFWNILYGYGERPFWIFGWCGFLLLFSSFIYWLSKGVFQVMGTYLVPVEDYWNNLYFSAVTFTTLGYGDFRPIGKIRVLASIEALLGIFFIALFIFTFARRTGGR